MEKYDFRTQRLFIDHDLMKGQALAPDRNQTNYLLNVLRLKEGASVLLFNGRDGEWRATIEMTGRKACLLTPQTQTRPQPKPFDLQFLFAPLKQARMDYMIQKAVEMGCGVLQPVLTHHTQVTKVKTERLRANAIEAAEQCGILNLPVVHEPLKLQKVLDNQVGERAIIFCDESADELDARQTLAPLRGKSLSVLIGPEGGFSMEERAALKRLDFVHAISLGSRILRADTAAVAALAVVQSTIGDWWD